MRTIVVDHPARRPQAHHAARRAHRLPDVPAADRRAGDAAGLRGHPRRPGRAGRRHDARWRPADGVRLSAPQAARRPDPAGRARHARRDDAAAADGRGRLPRDGPRRGDARGHRRTPSGCPTTCPGGSATCSTRCWPPAARSSAAIQLPDRPRRRRHHRDLPARRARGPATALERRRLDGSTCRSRSSPPRWTSGSTRRATSCPASATPATGSTAWSDPFRGGPAPTGAPPSHARPERDSVRMRSWTVCRTTGSNRRREARSSRTAARRRRRPRIKQLA